MIRLKGVGSKLKSRSIGQSRGSEASVNSESEKYPHSPSSPMTYPKKMKSSPSGDPSVTYHVHSPAENLTCTIESPIPSWEVSGGRVFLRSHGKRSITGIGVYSFD